MFDFDLTIPEADLSSVPENFQSLYSRDGDEGDYTLNPDLAKRIADLGALDTTMQNLRSRENALTKENKAFKRIGETPAETRQSSPA